MLEPYSHNPGEHRVNRGPAQFDSSSPGAPLYGDHQCRFVRGATPLLPELYQRVDVLGVAVLRQKFVFPTCMSERGNHNSTTLIMARSRLVNLSTSK
jgi:hypothetical protein